MVLVSFSDRAKETLEKSQSGRRSKESLPKELGEVQVVLTGIMASLRTGRVELLVINESFIRPECTGLK